MKKSEIYLEDYGHNFSCNLKPARSHYKFFMRLGRVFPSTRAQARYFISENLVLDLLNKRDVERIENLLNKYGFEGNYKYTQSKYWVRLQNHNDLYKALKKEFKI